MEIKYPTDKTFLNVRYAYSDATYAAKLRRLKELASKSKDRKLELEFFSEELIAKRHHESKGGALIINYFYQLFSGFGCIIWLPFIWLLTSVFAFAEGYLKVATNPCADIFDARVFSFSQSVSFSAWSRNAATISKSDLFISIDSAPGIFHVLAVSQNTFSIFMLSLIVLALRNRFKL